MIFSNILMVVALANGLTFAQEHGESYIIQDELIPAVLERQSANHIRALPPPEVQNCLTRSTTKGGTGATLTVRPPGIRGVAATTITVKPPGYTPPPDPNNGAEASKFCSEYIQPSKIVTITRTVASSITFTTSRTVLITKTTTVFTSKPPVTTKPPTSPTTKPPTSPTTTKPGSTGGMPTVICPIPTSGLTCGLKAIGKEEYNIYSGTARDAESCHQRCLEIRDCKSFQVPVVKPDFNSACNLYNVASGGDNTIPSDSSPLIFYDRNCPDFSPPECPRRRAREEEQVLKRGQAALALSTPSYFSTIASASLSTVCSCLVTKPLPTASITVTTSKTTLTTEFITKTLTQTSIVTVTSIN